MGPITLVRRGVGAVERGVRAVLAALRGRWRWFDHLMVAAERYEDRFGNRQAAALTYYAFLAFFPLTALAFALVGYAVVIDPSAATYVTKAVDDLVPGLADQLQIQDIAKAKEGAGLIGLALLLWGGLGWVGSLRGTLRFMWETDPKGGGNFVVKKAWDVLVLLSLGLILLISVALSGFATQATHGLVSRFGLSGVDPFVRLLSIAFALAADMTIYYLMFSQLSGTKARGLQLARGTLFGSVGLELLKYGASLLVGHTTRNPIYASFAVTVGLLVWINLAMRLTMFTAAWTATGKVVTAVDVADGATTVEGGG